MASGQLNTSEIEDSSAAIHSSTKSLLHLVNNLLDWSKMRTGRLPLAITRFNLKDLADTVLGYYFDMASQKKVRLENKVDAALEIEADENMLNTVLRNLVSNALKFTGENGEIILSAFQQQNKLIIRVADTGQGMDAAQLETLFSRKKYERGKGGLGLLLCNEMVAKHKGTIQAESAPGQGTAFTITLPAGQKGNA
jgi:signal transduction histidine kinase